jgi:protein-tyrosine phosphatase
MLDHVLVVCVGNVCRSPMGAALLAERLRGRPSARVASAGLAALVGRPAEPEAVALMAERGLDLSGHRATQVTPELLAAHDLVLVMEAGQVRAVEALAPAMRGRVHRLGRFGDFDVPDPFQQPRAAFERARDLILRGLDDFERAFWR